MDRRILLSSLLKAGFRKGASLRARLLHTKEKIEKSLHTHTYGSVASSFLFCYALRSGLTILPSIIVTLLTYGNEISAEDKGVRFKFEVVSFQNGVIDK